MRCAIIQYFIDPFLYEHPRFNKLETIQPLAELSKRSFEVYCEKYNIDFVRITRPKLGYRHPTYERFDLWMDESWWKKYDQICYVDSDVFALPHAPNIFENYQDLDTFKFCRYEPYRIKKIKDIRKEFRKTLLSTCNPKDIKEKFFQAGVFILTKKSAEHMKPWTKLYNKLDHNDAEILVWSAIKSKVPVTEMDELYNYKNAFQLGKPSVYFLHCYGHKKKKQQNVIQQWLNQNGVK
jgi:hypothetical protein